MGALFGLGIDNAIIELDNEEVPILDGSAKKFVNEGSIDGKVSAEDAELKVGSSNRIALRTKTLSVEPFALLSGKIKCGN